MLTSRLQTVMDFLVDKSQAGFVPGRLLNDNILLGHELVKGYCWKGVSPRCMVKIDMQKAYDSLEWVFLAMNIPSQFLKWIMTCVSTVSYSIVINGKPIAPFDAKRGMRQGDPLSPYLFVLAMEYLTRLMKTLKNKPDFNFHPRYEKLNIVQLNFADDLLLFCRGDFISTQMLYDCFHQFSASSGLIANQGKSSIYFGGVPVQVQQQILSSLGFSMGSLPFRYLGVPLSAKRLSVNQCQPLLDKILAKVQH